LGLYSGCQSDFVSLLQAGPAAAAAISTVGVHLSSPWRWWWVSQANPPRYLPWLPSCCTLRGCLIMGLYPHCPAQFAFSQKAGRAAAAAISTAIAHGSPPRGAVPHANSPHFWADALAVKLSHPAGVPRPYGLFVPRLPVGFRASPASWASRSSSNKH